MWLLLTGLCVAMHNANTEIRRALYLTTISGLIMLVQQHHRRIDVSFFLNRLPTTISTCHSSYNLIALLIIFTNESFFMFFGFFFMQCFVDSQFGLCIPLGSSTLGQMFGKTSIEQSRDIVKTVLDGSSTSDQHFVK